MAESQADRKASFLDRSLEAHLVQASSEALKGALALYSVHKILEYKISMVKK
jgi:hypothetical protein